jgi:hypothetical protein
MNFYLGHLVNLDIEKMASALSSIESNLLGSAKPASNKLLGSVNEGFQNLTKKTNLQSTIPKAMEKADVQPLHVRSGDMNAPKDITTSLAFSGKNKNLSHIKDPRLINSRTKLR